MKKTIFIGQAMPRLKTDPHDWSSLNNWLYSIGITGNQIRKYFLYSALVDYFPGSAEGSHRIPTRDEISKERHRLRKTMKKFSPEITVPVGRLSIAYCLDQKVSPLRNSVGRIYHTDPYNILGHQIPVIPFPHPSGASTWHNKEENKKLLTNALKLLKQNLAR